MLIVFLTLRKCGQINLKSVDNTELISLKNLKNENHIFLRVSVIKIEYFRFLKNNWPLKFRFLIKMQKFQVRIKHMTINSSENSEMLFITLVALID